MTKETSPISWTGFSTQDKRELSLIFPIPGFTAGSIEETKTISQTTGVFSINSVKDASGGTGTIIYAWEKKSDGKWTSISGQTGKNLTNAPCHHRTYERIPPQGRKRNKDAVFQHLHRYKQHV